MEPARFQIRLAAILLVVACLAVNFWLFRWSILLGLLGLNVTKHVLIACLCQSLGVDRPRVAAEPPGRLDPSTPTDDRAVA
jgi:hypothetical protein